MSFLFDASYPSQGYGGSIPTRHHTDMPQPLTFNGLGCEGLRSNITLLRKSAVSLYVSSQGRVVLSRVCDAITVESSSLGVGSTGDAEMLPRLLPPPPPPMCYCGYSPLYLTVPGRK